MCTCVNQLRKKNTITKIISGGARGADHLAEQYAAEYTIQLQIYPADWNTYGKSAGYIRNKDIIAAADIVYAFWDGKSVGTANSIRLANMQYKPVLLYLF